MNYFKIQKSNLKKNIKDYQLKFLIILQLKILSKHLIPEDLSEEDLKEVVKLILSGADNNHSNKALIFASVCGYATLAQILIEAGTDVNATDMFGKTTLMCASRRNHKEIVEMLMEAGADVDVTDEDGYGFNVCI